MALVYHLVESTGTGRSLTVFDADGTVLAVPDTHPNFDRIVELLRTDGDPTEIKRLIDRTEVLKEYAPLSERISLRGKKLYFDGDRIKGPLVKHIIRLHESGDDQADALIAFLEKVATNPSEKSRDALYRWLRDRDFTITADGDFIAYKGLSETDTSISHGRAMVDGVVHNGQIPNPVGAVVTMPRHEVDGDVTVGCGTGLHVATHRFATNFGHRGNMVSVKVNPRDVVSVPSDSVFEKMRVCRYQVIEKLQAAYTEPVWDPDDNAEDDDDFYEETADD